MSRDVACRKNASWRTVQEVGLSDVSFLEEELNEVARGYKCRVEIVGDMVR